MMNTANISLREPVATEKTGTIFSQYWEELQWVANFLTGDEMVASACVADACALAELENTGLQEWLLEWARLATILSAVRVQKTRIAQLSPAYTERRCIHGGHATLSSDSVELLVEESHLLMTKLDVLGRCALVLCGLEKRSVREAALLLCVDQTSVEGAYCAALEVLEVIGCEQFQRQNDFAAVCN